MAILTIMNLMFLGFIVFPNSSNRIFYESDIGLGFIGLVLSWKLVKIHWSVGLMFLIACSSVFLMMNNQDIYQHTLQNPYRFKLAAVTVATYITVLSFGVLPFLFSKEFFVKILSSLFFISIIDASWMLIRTVAWDQSQCYAMLSNPAIDASFIACFIPCALHLIKKNKHRIEIIIALIIMILAIIISQSSTGVGAIGIAIASYLLISYGKKSFKFIIPLAIGISGGSYFYLKEELLNSNGRLAVWKMAIEFYRNEINPFIGAGIGTFFVWGPEIQLHNAGADKGHLFTWMHNDWLQVFFEMGIIGLAALIILYGSMLVSSWKKKNALFPIVCTYGFVGLTQMPLRAFAFQLLGCCLIILCFNKRELCENIY